jgi:3-oxoacyl-[acyl-carrier-protein] synthase II
MMKIKISGIGVVGGFGCGVAGLISCLTNGVRPPAESGYGYRYPADTSSLENFAPKKSMRRIDHFSQMALLGAFLALEDAGIPSPDAKRTGLVVCSGYGASQTTFSFLDSVINDGDVCASPTLFSNSVHNSAAGHISILLKLGGPCMTVSQFGLSVHSALMSACRWLEEGRADQVLFGAVDEYCDVLGYCWQRFFGKNENGVMKPLTPGLQSAIPGEGAAFFVLSKTESNSSKYGSVVDVRTGRASGAESTLSDNCDLLILAADGHKNCDKFYQDAFLENINTACYSPLYGSLPIGPAFDMAIAALSLKEGRLFTPPASLNGNSRITAPSVPGAITCLKLGNGNEFGMISLRRD